MSDEQKTAEEWEMDLLHPFSVAALRPIQSHNIDIIRRIQNATFELAAKWHDMQAFSAKSSAKAEPRASDDCYADAERHEEYAKAIRALKEPLS